MRYFVTLDGTEHVIDVAELPGGGFDVRLQDQDGKGKALDVEVSAPGGPLTVHVAGRVFDLVVDNAAPNQYVFASGRRATVTVESSHQRAAAAVRSQSGGGAAKGTIKSPMPGKVVKVLVKEGDEVDVGRPLVVVEAMKMENELIAEGPGVVKKVFVQPGDAVEGGAKLIIIE
jgi:biotin carboxyl carrier protein